MKKCIISMALCLVMIFAVVSVYSKPVDAAASNKAVRYLKGKWYSVGMVEPGKPRHCIKFTKKYVKWYIYNSDKNRYVYFGKDKIVSTKKYKKGYLIKIKGRNGKYCYRTSDYDKNTLDCFGTWNKKEFPDKYSGTSSLERY